MINPKSGLKDRVRVDEQWIAIAKSIKRSGGRVKLRDATARRFMKNERAGKYLQANAPVHEVYLRLVDFTKIQWRERAQFLAMAAQMTPRILVTAARARGAQNAAARHR